MEALQTYWWLLVAVLGGALVFLLFVQGGQILLWTSAREEHKRELMINALGSKWELTFTTLVVFGGAAFASFPVFYATSFGGAYWLWMALLLSFVVQATAYEFRVRKGNIYGTRFYDTMLLINGALGVFLLGEAVGMFFFGAPFTISRAAITDIQAPAMVDWAPTHGLETMVSFNNIVFGLMLVMLAVCLGAQYILYSVDDEGLDASMRKCVRRCGPVFVLLFLVTVYLIFSQPQYLSALFGHWYLWASVLAGVLLVLAGLGLSGWKKGCRRGLWYTGAGAAIVVVALLMTIVADGGAYLRSTVDAASSLTLANSSASRFTLTVMSWVSVLVPFVLGYIVVVWRKMNARPADV